MLEVAGALRVCNRSGRSGRSGRSSEIGSRSSRSWRSNGVEIGAEVVGMGVVAGVVQVGGSGTRIRSNRSTRSTSSRGSGSSSGRNSSSARLICPYIIIIKMERGIPNSPALHAQAGTHAINTRTLRNLVNVRFSVTFSTSTSPKVIKYISIPISRALNR